MNRMSEWEELYMLPLGTTKWYGLMEGTRVPGGIIYKLLEDRSQHRTEYDRNGAYQSITDEEISVSITFAPFPPGLYEKLSQL